MLAGLIADVVKHLGADLPNLPKLLASIKRELKSDEPDSQRTALFCFGILAQHQPSLVQDSLTSWLQVGGYCTVHFLVFMPNTNLVICSCSVLFLFLAVGIRKTLCQDM